MPYWIMAEIRYGAACVAVAHSEGKGADEQLSDVGAMVRSIAAAESPEARVVRTNEGWGMGVAVMRVVMATMAAVMSE